MYNPGFFHVVKHFFNPHVDIDLSTFSRIRQEEKTLRHLLMTSFQKKN